jgi:hypothetical protein
MPVPAASLEYAPSVFSLAIPSSGGSHFTLSLSDSTYQAIKPPRVLGSARFQDCYLGKSKKGVYYVLILGNSSRLQLWVLEESRDGYAEWMLEHDIDLQLILPRLNARSHVYMPWILQDNYNENKYISVFTTTMNQ